MTRNRDPLPPDEIAEHLADLGDVPMSILPDDSAARLALVWLISSGLDVYTYASGGATFGTWCVWLGPLNDATHGVRGRVAVVDWCEQWEAVLAEMGLAPRRIAAAPTTTEAAKEVRSA